MNIQSKLVKFLASKKVDAKIEKVESSHPLYIFYLSLGVSAEVAKIKRLSQEIGLALRSLSEPIILPDYKSGFLRLEIVVDKHPIIDFHSTIKKVDLEKYSLPLVLGTTNITEPFVLDLQSMPHLLIGGTTGSGKSMMLHSIINSLMNNAKEKNIEFALVDPKQVEFSIYEDSPFLIGDKVINASKEYAFILDELILSMNNRLVWLKKERCRDIKELRAKKGINKASYKILVIDELADLVYTYGKSFLNKLIILAQKCRAAGIHIVIATQHPSSKIIPGELKANFSYRIGCKVASNSHSRVLFDIGGAEKLLGKGDAFISGGNLDMQRFRGALVNLDKVAEVQRDLNRGFFGKMFFDFLKK